MTNSPSKVCSRCGETKPRSEFLSTGGICKDCKRAYNAVYYREHITKVRVRSAANKAQQRGIKFVEDVDLEVVYKRDNGICQICHEAVDWNRNRARDPMGATLDHIEPIHSYATVRLAHRTCNAIIKNWWK